MRRTGRNTNGAHIRLNIAKTTEMVWKWVLNADNEINKKGVGVEKRGNDEIKKEVRKKGISWEGIREITMDKKGMKGKMCALQIVVKRHEIK